MKISHKQAIQNALLSSIFIYFFLLLLTVVRRSGGAALSRRPSAAEGWTHQLSCLTALTLGTKRHQWFRGLNKNGNNSNRFCQVLTDVPKNKINAPIVMV